VKVSRPLALRLILLAVLLAVGLFLTLRTIPRVQRYQATEELCAAAERQDWRQVLAAGTELIDDDPAGRRAAQCRCRALLETDDPATCVELMESLLEGGAGAEEGDDWLPNPTLTALVVADRERTGDLVAAAALARRGARAYPGDEVLGYQELAIRSRIEDEVTVLTERERLLEDVEDADPAGLDLRIRIASRWIRRGDFARGLDLLGEDPKAFPEELRDEWFAQSTEGVAGLGRADELAAAFEEWERRGSVDAVSLEARHALLRSMHQIEDADGTTSKMLAGAVARGEQLGDTTLAGMVYTRYLATLVVNGRHEEALALYDEIQERFGEIVGFMEREDILRSATQAYLGEAELSRLRGEIRFRLPEARPGDRLLISPDVDQPVDAPYIELPIGGGAATAQRAIGTWPQRWVLRDGRGRVAGSGAVWPRPGERVDFEIERRAPRTSTASSTNAPAPEAAAPGGAAGDGRRRVFQVILDCADWRIVQYGLARGELPFLEWAIASGRRAVLDSFPPFTSLAITKLVRPRKQGVRSFPELAYQLGVEIEGLNFVGENPLSGLEWVLPEEPELFETFARAGLGTVNLLHSHGSLQVGRNAEIVGPGDSVRPLEQYRSSRPLADVEEEVVRGVESEVTRAHLAEMAADFDVVVDLVGEPDVDFVTLRVASLDLFTHGRFQALLESGQDDGDLVLYRIYRYVDGRLAELHRALDGDDVLIVMSDHGIRTPMEHDRRAMFLALGGGIEPGRIEGEPPLQHVSGWVADLLGVEVDWPGAGTLEWIPPP
jgi:hypothetical protein